MSWSNIDAIRRAEDVLRSHGIPNEKESVRQGPRSPKLITAIILDVQAANAAVEDEAE